MNEKAERVTAVARALAALHRADWSAMTPEGRQAERAQADELLALLDVLGYQVERKPEAH